MRQRKNRDANRETATLTLDWEESGSLATIRQGGFLLNAARLIGVPFLLAGGYLLYHFFAGLLNNDLTIVGWIVMPLLGVGVALPGWCLLMWRRHALLDRAKREVSYALDFIFFERRWVAPLNADSYVRLRYEQGSTSSTQGAFMTHSFTRYDIHVDVVTPRQNDTMIALFAEAQKEQALAIAARAAAFLGIPVQNKMVEGGDVNSGGVVVDKDDPEAEE